MRILFEIPVYALGKEQLFKRVTKEQDKWNDYMKDKNLPIENMRDVIAQETFPYRCWEYNHIAGYIRIFLNKMDIKFEIFLPRPQIQRYFWKSHKKVFLSDTGALGTHFYVGGLKTNEEICNEVSEMLDWIAKDHIKAYYKHFYIDRSAFDALNEHIDYMSIIKEENSNG